MTGAVYLKLKVLQKLLKLSNFSEMIMQLESEINLFFMINISQHSIVSVSNSCLPLRLTH